MNKRTFKLNEPDFIIVKNCPLCTGDNREVLRIQNNISIYKEIYPNYGLDIPDSFAKRQLSRCKDCGHVHWEVIPKLECLPSYEEEILDYGFDESRALNKKAKYISQFLNNDSTLVDIGACRGELLQAIRKLNQSAVLIGIEPSFELNHESDHIRIKKALFNSEVPLDRGSVGVFTAIDVFEHMPRLDEIFDSINLFLKKGGVVYIESPDGNYFYNRFINYSNVNLFWIEHLSFLSRESIDYICQKFGFEKILVENIAHTETDSFRRGRSMIKGLVLNKIFRDDRPMYINSADHLKIVLRKK